MRSVPPRLAASLALILAFSGRTSPAAMISFAGQADNLNRFRTTPGVTYGTAGYVFYTTERSTFTSPTVFNLANPLTYNDGTYRTLASIPSYLSLANNGQSYVVGGFSYPLIDDPSSPAGPSVAQVESGLALNNFISIGTAAPLLNITLGSGFPAGGLRVGVFAIGSGEDAMGTVRLTQTAGIGTGAASANRVGSPQIFTDFFDITGANAGDVITLSLIKNAADRGINPNVAYLGLTFDLIGPSAVPEPSSLMMGGSGILILGGYLRARRVRKAA